MKDERRERAFGPPFLILSAVYRALVETDGRAAALLIFRALLKLPGGRRLVLQTGLASGEGYEVSRADTRWIGKRGTAVSSLRLAGTAEIDGKRLEVVSDGELIESGAAIEVTRVDGGRIIVRRVNSGTQQ